MYEITAEPYKIEKHSAKEFYKIRGKRKHRDDKVAMPTNLYKKKKKYIYIRAYRPYNGAVYKKKKRDSIIRKKKKIRKCYIRPANAFKIRQQNLGALPSPLSSARNEHISPFYLSVPYRLLLLFPLFVPLLYLSLAQERFHNIHQNGRLDII